MRKGFLTSSKRFRLLNSVPLQAAHTSIYAFTNRTMATNGAASTSSTSQPLKVLMLHGFTQSGPVFYAKSRALEKALCRSLPNTSFSYPTGPMPLRPTDIPGFELVTKNAKGDETEAYAWWRRSNTGPEYVGIQEGLAKIAATIIEEGPFDGVVGFSQGGCAAGMVAALLEGKERVQGFERREKEGGLPYPSSFLKSTDSVELIQPPLKFAIIYSGFAAPSELYSGFYEPPITTSMLHFIGSLDSVVDEARSRKLIAACAGEEKVVVHPGGHFVPSQKAFLEAAVGFVLESTRGKQEKKAREEERVEDMEVPF
ncbi:MAG: hypothetical protein FRX48_07891 [Lasallia pustulata]|uniref:Serine hydrolase domain-containing protein n=2 Tax=Lasallia pustulata TaxID=136370 RepID=A0A5M8PFN4_9LECA|nr:MAG: hypothetical protein FRX48_07891 [Lasallia pustulata]